MTSSPPITVHMRKEVLLPRCSDLSTQRVCLASGAGTGPARATGARAMVLCSTHLTSQSPFPKF